MTKIDEATGLPALPAGHFWRVGEVDHAGDHRISIRKGNRFWSSTEVAYSWCFGGISPKKLEETAEKLYGSFIARHTNRANAATLVGDYPPKKLKKDTV